MAINTPMNRRKFAKTTLLATAATALAPGFFASCSKIPQPMKRSFGKLGFDVTTMGLGGQSSIQWTPEGIDPVKIILKAFDLGINYFDTSNLYGPSQGYYGQAFRIKNLIPGEENYKADLRKSIFLTTKTHLRFAKGNVDVEGVNNWTNGENGSHTVDDLKRSLSFMFGDAQGNYPEGAYVDMVLMHSVSTRQEVDALYEGLEDTNPEAERIGALAALRDYRDGTNRTGLNPKNEKLLRHIGFSGHWDPAVMMYMIQRDRSNLLDAMLVAINANDKLMFNMQYNVIPLAAAKNMGIIAMKVFADGAMYTKPAEWSGRPDHVVLTVGSKTLSSRKLIKYSLTTPGVHLAIIGIGQISEEEEKCQLTDNLLASQVEAEGMSLQERESIEQMAAKVKEGKTNYFQTTAIPLTAPDQVSVSRSLEGDSQNITLAWNTAFAGDAPLKMYEIWRDDNKVYETAFTPQLTTDPFTWMETLDDNAAHTYKVKVVDGKDRVAESVGVKVEGRI